MARCPVLPWHMHLVNRLGTTSDFHSFVFIDIVRCDAVVSVRSLSVQYISEM